MKVILIGCMVGAVIFSTRSESFIGALTGGALAYLFTKVLLMGDKIATLENKLKERGAASHAKESAPPPSATAADTQPKEISPSSQTFEKPPKLTPRPVSPVAKEEVIVTRSDGTIQEPISGLTQREEKQPPQKEPAQEEQTDIVNLWDIVKSYFTGGNVVVRVGVIVLFFWHRLPPQVYG